MREEELTPEQPYISDRKAFEIAIKENPDDIAYRLIFADWLDDHNEHDEADRQRKYPEARKWIESLCEKDYGRYRLEDFIVFGEIANQFQAKEINVTDFSSIGLAFLICDRIEEYWRAWAIVTGLPLTEGIEKKCYYAFYKGDLLHLAGSKSEGFTRMWDRLERIEEDQEAERMQQEYDIIQQQLEQDRP